MHIVIYHPAVIPPPHYGGTERVLDYLAQGLITLGHRVTLMAKPGSSVTGATLAPCPPETPKDSPSWKSWIPADADLIHFSATPEVLPSVPFLITIHGNGKPGEKFHPNTVFLSKKHAENHGGRYFVYHGINPELFPYEPLRESYLTFLAKAGWKVKNLKGALHVAKKAKLPLHVMGNRWGGFPGSSWNPFAGKVSYHGMVGDAEKKSLLQRAKALLFPVRWHEPFGLAVIEALASGCPVFGTPYGSLPELVTPDVGTLSASAGDWVRQLKEKTFDPEACRKRVMEKFTHLKMAKSYLELYEEILNRGGLKQKANDLYWRLPHSATQLLPWN